MEIITKKKVLILSNYAGAYTGFGRNCKALMSYLYEHYNNQLEIAQAAAGMQMNSPEFQRYPWKVYGVLPNNPHEINMLNQDPNRARLAAYGDFAIEDIVFDFKPDVLIVIEDIWANAFVKNKSFFGHIPVIFWETIDSLPVLKEAIDNAKKATQYWTWSQFAEKALHKEGIVNAKTQYPCLDTKSFHRLPQEKRNELRRKFGLPQDAFIMGFVFRNQLRKLVNKLIEGYAMFKQRHPEIKNTFLYTHTHYGEGWNIPDLCKQYGVNPNEVLCTYVCKSTREYAVLPFKGQDIDNAQFGIGKSMVTSNVTIGVTEDQLNEIYNFMDLYIHPATSGACEMPCVEAALTELPVATCNYSFGEDIIALNKGSFEIEHTFYTEIQTQFLKSNPFPSSIAKIMANFYNLKHEKRIELGKKSRQWALENYSTDINAEKIAKAILEIPQHTFHFDKQKSKLKNQNYPMQDISNETDWLTDMYKNILFLNVPTDDPGLTQWLQQLKNGAKREDIYKFFIDTAKQDNAKLITINFEDTLDKEGWEKRILITMPESAGDLLFIGALLEDLKSLYPEDNIYLATNPEYMELLAGNPYIHKIIQWIPQMDNLLWLEGQGNHQGLFKVAYLLHSSTQRFMTYVHNGDKDKTYINFNKPQKFVLNQQSYFCDTGESLMKLNLNFNPESLPLYDTNNVLPFNENYK